ncbi:IclR family transcriptional regulator [Nesterenkonia sphaerica]|uniref:IclR family transcriptional regulator n=1 Tax=Nesterenkonia sphaerica TaxID=1804988 RepID=A0A5R9AMA5_9MICC|nr:IclR family transcriptional regulator [Nesterenkonia sphaerica]TLP79941.1 IclR family transcriptional regulator [Nesterenkonia sphaerica]
MANSPTGESLLDRLDRILDAFSAAESLLTAAEIARRTGLPSATAHRLCTAMADRGWLESLPGGYMVGTRLWEMTNRSASTMKLAIRARPYLSDVHAVVGHHVQLGVIDADEVLFIDRLSGRGAPEIHGGVAGRLPLHLSATGMVLLAHAPDDFRDSYRDRCSGALPGQGAPVAEERLEVIRRRGFCAQTGAIESGVTGVAVPIRKRGEGVVAALGVVTDDPDAASRPGPWAQTLLVAARGIQRETRVDRSSH